MRRISRLLGLVVLSAGLAIPAVAGEVVQIQISDLAFAPAAVTVHVGDTVEWVNADFVDHTATSRNGDWDVLIAAGKSARLHVTRAGATEYYCRFHPQMIGTIRAIEK